MRLSASRISVLARCQREYIYNYTMKIPQEKSKALLLGSAWHEMLELKVPDLTELDNIDPEYPWADCLFSMMRGYDKGFPEHKDEVAREIKVEDDIRICIIDGVVVDSAGWWIVENKTRSSAMDMNEARSLPGLIQVQMYAHAAPFVAEQAWQDPDSFAGVKYVTTIKPAERRKKTETKEEFGQRLSSETQVIEIPKSCLTGNPEPAMVQALARAQEADRAFESGNPMDVPCNPASCFRYNSPCPYFSLCYKEEVHERDGRRFLGAK